MHTRCRGRSGQDCSRRNRTSRSERDALPRTDTDWPSLRLKLPGYAFAAVRGVSVPLVRDVRSQVALLSALTMRPSKLPVEPTDEALRELRGLESRYSSIGDRLVILWATRLVWSWTLPGGRIGHIERVYALLVANDTLGLLCDALRSAGAISGFSDALAAEASEVPRRFATVLEIMVGALDAEGRGHEIQAWYSQVCRQRSTWLTAAGGRAPDRVSGCRHLGRPPGRRAPRDRIASA